MLSILFMLQCVDFLYQYEIRYYIFYLIVKSGIQMC